MNTSLRPSVRNLIYIIRGQKVMLDRDLAALYRVETRILNQSVKRNLNRFPADFLFQLTETEEESLRSQFVISNAGRGGKRYLSFAFTELGIAMLSSVLKSDEAIQTNIEIMRAFFELRTLLNKDSNLLRKVEKIEQDSHELFKLVFRRLDQLETTRPFLSPKRRKIGI